MAALLGGERKMAHRSRGIGGWGLKTILRKKSFIFTKAGMRLSWMTLTPPPKGGEKWTQSKGDHCRKDPAISGIEKKC